ncbi:MAG: hypothetical protein C0515_09435 [Novosphingobium sp.]|nr:hypothetical protein [Novosphingobium sp.]
MAMKKQLALTTAMAATLTSLSACSSGNDWEGSYADNDTRVCVDEAGRRVDDSQCRSYIRGGGYYGWYYVNRGSRLPYYGDSVRDTKLGIKGSPAPVAGRSYADAPSHTNLTRSAAMSRGGFGSSSRSFGGGRS